MQTIVSTVPQPESGRVALSFSSTLPRQVVHRHAIHEVFVTDAAELPDGTVRCVGQLPRTHSYFSDQSAEKPSYDIVLLTEVFRQAQFVMCHNYLGVPLDEKFIFVDGDVAIEPSALEVGEEPARAQIDIRIVERFHRKEVLNGITVAMEMTVDGIPAASKRMSARWMSTSSWNKLREKGRAQLDFSGIRQQPTSCWIEPATVGRTSRRNVVVGGISVVDEGISGALIVNQRHPSLFDHPLDHVPAMLMFEAFRQIGLAVSPMFTFRPGASFVVKRYACDFVRFCELEFPTCFRVESGSVVHDASGDVICIPIEIVQLGEVVAKAEVEIGYEGVYQKAPMMALSS